MKLSDHKELKKEIIALSPKEKDKLLLRLIAKDKVLTEHLHFTLLEDSSDLQIRVERIMETIEISIDEKNIEGKLTARENLIILRKLMKLINHNLKVTKAAFEDVSLRVFLLTSIRKEFKFKSFSRVKDYELIFRNNYLKATLITLNKYHKLHEDLQFDLKMEVNGMLASIYDTECAKQANEMGVPRFV